MSIEHTRRINEVKQALTSLELCSVTTVNSLNDLLDIKAEGSRLHGRQDHNTVTANKSTGTRHGDKRVTSRSRPATNSAGANAKTEPPTELSAQEKVVLATEVVNSTLKVLTAAVRAPQKFLLRTAKGTDPGRQSRLSDRSLVRSCSDPKRPLHPRPLNRISSSPAQSPSLSRQPSTAPETHPGLLALAQCARLGLSHLRVSEGESKTGPKTSTLQIDNAMSALIGKLLALKLDDLALKEIRILRNRLADVLQTSEGDEVERKATKDRSAAGQRNGKPEEDDLASVLTLGRVGGNRQLLELVIVTQIQALKLIASTARVRSLLPVLEALRLSSPNSPVYMILEYGPAASPSDKVAQWLQTISHILLSLGSIRAGASDRNKTVSRSAVAPELAFQLRCLGLQMRVIWWKYSSHAGDVTKEVMKPFLGHAQAYAKRADATRGRHDLVAQAYGDLTKEAATLEAALDRPKDDQYQTRLDILKLLGTLAREVDLIYDAIQWTQEGLRLSEEHDGSSAIRCAQLTRIVALRLKKARGKGWDNGVLDSLEQVDKALDGSIRGASNELDEMLTDVSFLRREISSFLQYQEKHSCSDRGSDLQVPPGAMKTCRNLTFACLRVFSRCLGHGPGSDRELDEGAIQRHQTRRTIFRHAVVSATDAALSLIKKDVGTDQFPWSSLDGILRDCLALAQVLDDLPKDAKSSTAHVSVLGPVATKVSNLYWSYCLRSEQNAAEIDDSRLLLCLQRSVDSARVACRAGATNTLLAIKLEKLGSMQISRGSRSQARQTLMDAIQTYVDNGVVRTVTRQSTRMSLRRISNQQGDVSALGKTLTALWQSTLKATSDEKTCTNLFDGLVVDGVERCCLLEWQLLIMSAHTGSIRSVEAFRSLLRATSDELLQIHTVNDSPLHRARVLISILRLLAEHRTELPDHYHERIHREASVLASRPFQTTESPLSAYQDDYRATLKICLALGDQSPDIETIRQSLMVWQRIVDSSDCLRGLEERIEDTEFLLKLLSTAADFFAVKGLRQLTIATLHLATRILNLQESPDSDELVLSLSRLGMQYLSFGYSGKAGYALTKAQSLVQQSLVSAETSLAWYQVYAEYLLILGNTEKCMDCLAASRVMAENDPEIRRKMNPSASLSRRIEGNRLIADASYIWSRAASESGLWSEALAHAKTCVKLAYRAWAGIEARSGKKIKSHAEPSDTDSDSLIGAMSAMTVSKSQAHVVMSTTHTSLNGSAFWSLVPLLTRALAHLSQLYSRMSLFQEAVYFAEQAQKIVEAVDAKPLIAENLAATASLHIRGGQLEKGREMVDQARETNQGDEQSKLQALLHCFQGQIHGIQGRLDDERAEYVKAEHAIEILTQGTFIHNLDSFDNSGCGLEPQIKSLSLHGTTSPRARSVKHREKKAHDSVTNTKGSKRGHAPASASPASSECSELLRIRGNILRLRAAVELLQRRPAVASSLLAQAESWPMDTQGVLGQRIGLSHQLLRQSLEDMSSDAVFCVMEESTISLPSIASIRQKAPKPMGELSPGGMTHASEKSPGRPHSKHLSRTKKSGHNSFLDFLRSARESLLEVLPVAATQGSTSSIWTLVAALSHVTVFLAATASGRTMASIRPVMPMLYAELARTLAMRRERIAIQAEKELSARDHQLKWPQSIGTDSSSYSKEDSLLDIAGFQKRYVDIIPPQWSVVSITLSSNMEELFIARLQPGQSPFILRLPLARHNCRDADEEVFDFKQVRAELAEIIESANFTAHDARDMTKKGAKSRWWAEREALDAQLRDLLLNVENIWLGGFRGVFSQRQHHPELLSRFQQSFHNLLDRHLPSRLKAPKKRKADRINLAPHILGLFVGLGYPSDADELDEPLMDLLYFVVDILQFHGEHNAYDEIDFDSIVVETKDAIRSYYDALPSRPADSSTNHTVLILDKSLQMFPWECLPCLQGLSVSRLPSLEALRERLMLQQRTTEQDNRGLHISRDNGTYILNPLGDLKATQETFEESLQGLPNWNAITQREPTETEFKEALERSELFLYFGHGSGSQYIRARTIRKLDRCAVALLMGCSSGCLTEAGEFELYGTPKNYLHAGCPALVATLWDVTDKDIDRFSHTVLQRWGLLPVGTTSSSSSAKHASTDRGTKARSRSKRRDHSPPPVVVEPSSSSSASAESLTKAVATARMSCVLKYLNGAAPVVYGIPVHLA